MKVVKGKGNTVYIIYTIRLPVDAKRSEGQKRRWRNRRYNFWKRAMVSL